MTKTHTTVKAHKRKLPALGTGKRFAAVEEKAKESGARDPAAVAAVAGREAHGAAQMAHYSAMGRHRAITLAEVKARRGGGK
jgi:hypothetical protein